MRKKSLGLNALFNGIRTVLNMLFPLITFPYVTRVLSVESLGKYDFALSVNNYFLLLASLGISTYAVREGAKLRSNKIEFDRFASEVFSVNLISTACSYLLLILCIVLIPKFHNYNIVIMVFSIEIIFTTLGTEWVYSIFEEYGYITLRSIVFKVFSIILLITLVKDCDDYVVYAGITVFANVGSNILNFIRAKRYCSLKFIFNENTKKHLKPIMVIFASTAATTIYINSDITMLGFMTSDYVVGIYSVASKVYRIVKQMLSAILIVSIPRLAMLMGQKRMNEYKNTLTKIFNVLVLLILPAVVGLFMMSKEIIILISGSAYVQATGALRLISIALIFCIFGWLYNQCVLIPAKKEKIVLIATLNSAVANIVINFVLIPLWEENAAAVSTIVAEAIMMLVCVYHGKKIVALEKGVAKNVFTVIIGCVVICLICCGVKYMNLGIVLTLIIAVGASIVGYGITLLLLKNEIVLDFTNKTIRLIYK